LRVRGLLLSGSTCGACAIASYNLTRAVLYMYPLGLGFGLDLAGLLH